MSRSKAPRTSHSGKSRATGADSSADLDRHDLYELAVTNADRVVPFLVALHGHNPQTLREDFSGSAALGKGWVRLVSKGRALAVDSDADPLRKATDWKGLTTLHADVRQCQARADIIAATNFPLGYWHTRKELVSYLTHATRCLNRHGIFVADMYGGRDAMTAGKQTQALRSATGNRIEYTWEQRAADPLTNRVLNSIHFKVTGPRSTRPRTLRDAFTYDWRLWSIPELKDAMLEAGFKSVEVYDRLGGALDQDGNLHVRPLDEGEPLDENYVVYLVARKSDRR